MGKFRKINISAPQWKHYKKIPISLKKQGLLQDSKQKD